MMHTGQGEKDVRNQQVGIQANRNVSARLTAAARLLRLSTSSRSKLFQVAGLRPGLLDRLFSAVSVLLLVFCLIIPTVTAVADYGYFASDQYESESRFTIRSSTPAQSLAEQQFASNLNAVEQIQFVSREQLFYVESFLDPRVPDDAMLPKRALWIGMIFAASLLLWGALPGTLHAVRNQISN